MPAEGGLQRHTAAHGHLRPDGADEAGKRIILVLAMHRSGSSMITRALKVLGVELGDRLMPPVAGENDTGFWEDTDIVELNETLLARAGRRWDSLEPLNEGALEGPEFSDLRQQAGALIARKMAAGAVFGFKDPRTAILFPFWRCVLEDMGITPAFVIPVRNPLEAAASLQRRNGFDMEKGVALWARHMIEAVGLTEGACRVFVDYSAVLEDPVAQLARMASILDLPMPPETSEEVSAFASGFVSRDLRHNVIGRRELTRSGLAARFVEELYDDLVAFARTETGASAVGDPARWAGILEGFGATRPLLRQIDRMTLRQEVQGRELEGLARQVAQQQAAAEAALSELSDARERAALLEAERREEKKRFEAEREGLVSELEEAETRGRARIEALRAEMRERLSAAESVHEQYRADMARDQAAEASALAAERAHALQVITDLERDLKREQVVSLERHRALGAALAEAHALRTSTTWKLAAPVRRLGQMAPGMIRAARLALKVIWWTLTLQLGARIAARRDRRRLEAQRSASPQSVYGTAPERRSGESIPASSQTAAGAGYAYAPFDPQPVARLLAEVAPGQAFHEEWLDHCAAFPLPFQAEARRQEPAQLSDGQARDWISRCAQLGGRLGPVLAVPDVTIIVPVYNQLPFTLSVIASVYRWPSRYTFEIIIADDGSHDQTRWLDNATLPRVRVIHNPQNLGFLRNCNEAASHARGRHIVLLNNDTIVLPGWLDGLVDTLEANPDIGLVGSKLIFPDARVQEVGGIVWQDGSAWNYGRGQNPMEPYLSFMRDCDYCSGASIGVRRADWEALGGFDAQTYENAYYEDTDLAFRIREAGKRVVVQPLSRLVHFEGISSGTDTGTGIKKYQVTNGERFHARWQKVLAAHRPNGQHPELERERSVRRRLLVIDTVTPTPDRDAGSLITFEMMRGFQQEGWRVSFVPEDNFAYLPPQTLALQQAGIEALYWPFYADMEDLLDKRGDEFDAVLIFRVTSTRKHLDLIRRKLPGKPVFYHVADLHHLRERREAELKGDTGLLRRSEQTRKDEVDAVRKSDVTIVHSEQEKEILKELVPGAEVYVFPWIAEPASVLPGPDPRSGITFVGGFNHPPNADAVLWFAGDVWPLIIDRKPDARLTIIGPNAPAAVEALGQDPRIDVLGWVPDLQPYLDRARLSIAPLRYGAGVKGKVVSSLAAGLPVVTTPIGAEGMGLTSGVDAEIAESPAAMADAVLRLLEDDAHWQRLSRGGLDFVERHYSRARARERIGEILALGGVP